MLREPSVVCASTLRKSKLFHPESSFLQTKLTSYHTDNWFLCMLSLNLQFQVCSVPVDLKWLVDGCQVCPIGTYNDAENSTSCSQCPNGATTENNGTVYEWECGRYFLTRLYNGF